jgi:4-hydroxy-4-methyl-2-oxoglutarate aldolase
MDIREALLTIPTAALSDAQAGMTTMDAGIKTRVPGLKLVGPAFTVRCMTGSIFTVHKALLEARPGDVLVVDGLGDATEALFGELMGRDAKTAGLAGAVIDGPVRDVAGLGELGLPTFSRHVTPRVGSNRRLGTVGARISCGGISVEPGDWIVGDDDGVVVVPREKVEQLVEAGLAIEDKERGVAARIDAGERIADILNFREALG